MFEGRFKQGQQQTAILEDVEGVVSVQSLEAFLQSLYLDRVKFDLNEPEHHIAAAIELARFADMCNITGMESQICRYLRDILIANPCPKYDGEVTVDIYFVTSEHIISATFLPQGHAVRRILAAATVDGYLFSENHKFAQEAREYPTYGVVLFQEVGLALKGVKFEQYKAIDKDPLTGDKRNIYRF